MPRRKWASSFTYALLLFNLWPGFGKLFAGETKDTGGGGQDEVERAAYPCPAIQLLSCRSNLCCLPDSSGAIV